MRFSKFLPARMRRGTSALLLLLAASNLPAANLPPTVSVNSPVNNARFTAPAPFTISATASDPDGSIARVEFFQNGTRVGSDNTSPYSISWTGAPAGAYALTARAFDVQGASTLSGPVNIQVTINRNPTADAHVRAGSSAAANFGAATSLEVQENATASSKRVAFLKFDAAGVNLLHTAKLRLSAKLSGSGTVSSKLFRVPSPSWIESGAGGITWNSGRPPLLPPDIGTFSIVGKNLTSYELDVTSFVRGEIAAGRLVVGFALTNFTVSTRTILLNSREAASGRPELILTPNQPPAVTMAAPAAGATLPSTTASVTLAATASDVDGGLASVEFREGATSLGLGVFNASSARYELIWNGASAGSHAVFARARDTMDGVTDSAAVQFSINRRPAVSITAPAEGAHSTVPATLFIDANASDPDAGDGIARVELYEGATLLGTLTTAPYRFTWNNALTGNRCVTARAYDTRGEFTDSSPARCFFVNLVPTVTLTSPAAGAVLRVPPLVSVTADADDPGGSVARVDFYSDGVYFGTDVTSPYSAVWANATPGSHVLTARAVDNLGAISTSAPVNVTVVQLDPDPGLTGYWKFDEGAGSSAFDSSGNGNTAAIAGPQWVPGQIGSSALQITNVIGAGNCAVIPNTDFRVLPPTGKPFSISLWLKARFLPPSLHGLLNNSDGSSQGWSVVVGGDRLLFWSNRSGGDLLAEGGPSGLTPNVWHHLVVTYNGSVGRVYLDGRLAAQGGGSIVGGTAPLSIGGGMGNTTNFPGVIDDVKIYNRELSLAEAALSGHWTFDEGTGSSARDTSGHDNSANLYYVPWGAARLGASGIHPGGGYGYFNNVNHATLPGTGKPFSVSFWFNPDSLPVGSRLLMGNEQTGVSGWRMTLRSVGPGTNDLVFAASPGSGTLSVTGRTVLLPGHWRKLTATYDGNLATLYLDGQWLGAGTGTLLGNALPVYFAGGLGGLNSFVGSLDDIRTYLRALTPDEVALNGHWRLDENMGVSAADSSGNGNHATLSSPAWGEARRGFAGLEAGGAAAVVPNPAHALLPPTGGPFSLSLWLKPSSWVPGHAALLSSHVPGLNGWQLSLYRDASGTNSFRFWSTDGAGTLDVWCPAPGVGLGQWTKLDVTFNGGIATLFVNGRNVTFDNGGIRASTASLSIGAAPGLAAFAGVIDEVKVYNRELDESEIGPVARVMWQAVWRDSPPTNLVLEAFAPAGGNLTVQIAAHPGLGTAGPTNGTLSVVNGRTVAYTPNPGYYGPDAFLYTVSDGTFTTSPTAVLLSVVRVHHLSPTGGAELPRDGTTPARAWVAQPAAVLDEIWRTNHSYDCFYYAPGVYENTGWQFYDSVRFTFRGTAAEGCKHIGAGRDQTTLRLINAWGSWGEGFIFATHHCYGPASSVNNFEVQDMTLDCNATGNPKFTVGEPITITLTLASPVPVDRVVLRWENGTLPIANYYAGPAADFSVSTLLGSVETPAWSTNNAAGGVDDLGFTSRLADRVLIVLYRRGPGEGLYGLREIEVYSGGSGPNLALLQPITAQRQEGGDSSMPNGGPFVIERAVDGDPATQWASGTQGMVGALTMSGSNLKFRNLKIVGFGTKAGRECFPFVVGVPCGAMTVSNFGNILIENCTLTDPAPANTDGCTVITMTGPKPYSLTNGVVRGCHVSNLTPGFTYAQAYAAQRVENCSSDHVSTGFYMEPNLKSDQAGGLMSDSLIGPVLIRSNVFSHCVVGVLIQFVADSAVEQIMMQDNQFILASSSSCWGFLSYDLHPNVMITNLTALRNVVRLADGSSQTGNSGGLFSSASLNTVFGGNILQLGTGNELLIRWGLDPTPANARRAFYANRNLSGTLLPVRQQQSGGPATEPQWP